MTPRTAWKTVLLRLSPETHRQITVAARSSGVSMQAFIEDSLERHIKSWAKSDIPSKFKSEVDRLVELSQELESPRRRSDGPAI
jgi:hypothetical protein